MALKISKQSKIYKENQLLIPNSCFCEVDVEEFTGENEYRGNCIPNSILLDPTYETELENIIMQIRAEKSQGVDGIPGFIIKRCFQQIKEPLLHLINASLELGQFPEIKKI
ncbi:hypothetical protein JTB14_015802 [Gonioctena quinquepunctata]|nr:hypothetical protein JTB14_015802 [Gonioctena quinquepunctata]